MPKNKRPVPRPSSVAPVEDDEVLARQLAELALDLAEQEDEEDGEPGAVLPQREEAFGKLLRNAFRKRNDDVLYGAIERARYTDVAAYQLLRARIEEAAGTVVLRREGAPAQEINAFAIPLFVHSRGGLKDDETFGDGEAFDALVASFQSGGLESPKAKVVLISHAYDLDEIDRITYSHLNDMVRDAAASMTEKKLVATPALERSIAGWTPGDFGPDDQAVELRFLLGFALKREDDPFYAVPDNEAAADAYFDARMERYRAWTTLATPLIKRCLARDAASLALHFLYQDMFFGAKEQGMAELAMLRMMSDINAALTSKEVAPGAVHAIAGPADVDDAMVLRVNLYDVAGTLLASSDKPLDLAADLQIEVDDICDALGTLGIEAVSVALKFDRDGQAQDVRSYQD